MKKRLCVLTIVFTFALFLVNFSVHADNFQQFVNLTFTGTGADYLGTDQYEYELNVKVVRRYLVGTLSMTENGEFLGEFRLRNGTAVNQTVSFRVFDNEGFMYHFSLLVVDNELDGGVVELKEGPDEVGLTGLTKAHFQLVP